MTIEEEFTKVLTTSETLFVLFWSKEEGWHILGNGCHSLTKEELGERGLMGLEQIVEERDAELCRTFLTEFQNRLDGNRGASPAREHRMEVSLRLKTVESSFGYYKIECHLQNGEDGRVCRLVTMIRALDSEEIYRLQLAQNVTNDKNPVFFNKDVQRIMDQHPEWKYVLIQFDVAKFKLINEQCGEEVGDELLNYFIHVLKLECNEYQLYTRLSADVFMIVSPYETEDDVLDFINRLQGKLMGYKRILYTLVFGVCYIDDIHGNLRSYGDGAAYARQSIKGNALEYVAFYDEDMKETARSRKFVEDNMELALKEREFIMFLQPKYSISENQMVGAEALVRWKHPERGIIPPMEFVPLFEQNGFVIKMDQYIWEEACKTIRRWLDEGMEPLPISVNLSRRHLRNNAFVDILNQLVLQYNIPKKYLEIEITESVENEDLFDGIARLKESGFTLLMDDFGSGYSSLNALKDTPFDVIKIDRGFLQDFISSEKGQRIVEHTVQMARDIGLDLVAEGVETEEQAVFLSRCGCDTAQGFYYAKPMTLEEFNVLRRRQIAKTM